MRLFENGEKRKIVEKMVQKPKNRMQMAVIHDFALQTPKTNNLNSHKV
jgi:hypothetical protein